MLGKIEGRRRRGQQRTRWLDGITGLVDIPPPTSIFIPAEFLAIFTSPAVGELERVLMDIPFLLSPTEDHAALPQPPLPQGSLLLSVLHPDAGKD